MLITSGLSLLRRNLHGRAARGIPSSSGCEQIVTESTHIDVGMPDFVLIGAPDVLEFPVGSPVRTSDSRVIFMDVVLEQPKPHSVCRPEVIPRTL